MNALAKNLRYAPRSHWRQPGFTLVGFVTGLAASRLFTKLVGTLPFNVTPNDPLTLGAVAAIIAIVASIACVVPAWRAARVNPLVVLREP